MPEKHKRILAVLAIMTAGIAFSWILLIKHREHTATVYKVFKSPNGKAQVVSYAVKPIIGKAFVGESDYPGIVRLEDSNGVRYAEAKMPIVQALSDVSWSEDRVLVYVFADWEIPMELR